jgi:hypothetical protein
MDTNYFRETTKHTKHTKMPRRQGRQSPKRIVVEKRNLNAENVTATGGSAVVMPLRGAMAASQS